MLKFLQPYHSSVSPQTVLISAEQASSFAKDIAQDFNPLHDADSKRFCVPGDLLFALTLARYGLSKNMTFKYTGMVGKDTELVFPNDAEQGFTLQDVNEKPYLQIQRAGETQTRPELIEAFTRAYVAFSGHSFPHVLVPLMKQHNVMIHPQKPMVIYDSMAFEFDRLDAEDLDLQLINSRFDLNGKRGSVTMEFGIFDSGHKIGSGHKTMVLSGLREYDQPLVDGLVELYEQSKAAYQTKRKSA